MEKRVAFIAYLKHLMAGILIACVLIACAHTCSIAQTTETSTSPQTPDMVLTEIEQPISPPVLVEPPLPQDLVIPETGIPDIFPPAEPAPGEDVIVFNADLVRVEPVDGEERVIARGNVTATYKNITVTSNTANYDSRTDVATFEENVTIRIDGQAIRGQRLSLTLPSRQYRIEGPGTVLPPSFFTSGVFEPVILGAGEISGVGRQRLIATDASATTCNLEEPHYVVTGSEVIVLPQQKIIVRRATLYALGRKIISLPRFVIPLRSIRERSNIIPQIGQSIEEGYFLKTAYNYLGSARQTGLLKLDFMSKKGLGQGIEHAYNLAKAAGTVYAYNLFDQTLGTRTLTGRVEHRQQFGDNIRTNFTSDYRNNSYLYAPQSTSWISSVIMDRNRPGADSNLAIRYDQESGFGRFNTLTSSLQHRQVFDPNTRGDFSFDYSTSSRPVTTTTGTTNATQGQIVSRGAVQRNYRLFDLGVSATKINDISDEAFIGQGFAGIERLPEIELSSDTTRLGTSLPYDIPVRMNFSAGRFKEFPDAVESDRFFLQLDSSAQRFQLSNRLALTAGVGFRQFVYGADSAQYAFDTSDELVYKMGENSSAGIGYRYMKPDGFTPFRFDQIGRYNMLNGRLNLQDSERFKLGLVTGYNFNVREFPWQDVAVRSLWAPSENYALFASTAYDPNRSRWRDLVNQVRLRFGEERFKFDLGTRYSFQQGKFGSVRGALDWQVSSKWRIEAFAGYNGFTKEFDYQNLRIQRDLHCWVASLTYTDRGGLFDDKSITLNLSIKAFPVFERFGLGQFGQPLSTSVGEVF